MLSFDHEAALFLLRFACFTLGLWLCLGGRRAMQAFLTGLLGTLWGWGGTALSRHLGTPPIVRLVLFTLFFFLGLCVGFFPVSLILRPVKGRTLPVIFGYLAAVPGAALCAWAVWRQFFPGAVFLWALFGVLSLWGILREWARQKRPRPTHTYEDLYRMPIPEVPLA